MKSVFALACLLLCLIAPGAIADETGASNPSAAPTRAMRDNETGVIYYLEMDGHHVSAFSARGRKLWSCETACQPAPGSLICQRTHIASWGQAHAENWTFQNLRGDPEMYLWVSFGRSFGVIRKSTGELIMEGQD